jgi:hypothetical protein
VGFFLKKAVKKQGKNNYQPNLISLMGLCANNYMLLLKLQAGNVDENQQRRFFINDLLAYTIEVIEVTRYTSLITIIQDKLITVRPDVVKELYSALHPKMTIRLYHDARMAEVISNQGITQIKPRYDYPNSGMHQQDEKQQINQFLNEWLHLCLQMGQVDVAMPINRK